MRKILIIHTRELCYYSGTFFLDRMEEALAKAGASVLRCDLLGKQADYDRLEEFAGERFDAIIDINSKLPYLIMDDGSYFLDAMDGPFFNYILDHPLYHHPGLEKQLKNYYAITIDHEHATFIDKYYPHMKHTDYLPVAGTEALTRIPMKDRSIDLLFTGTYLDKDPLEDKITALGPSTSQLIHDLIDEWDYQSEILDNALWRILKREFNLEDEKDAGLLVKKSLFMKQQIPEMRKDIQERYGVSSFAELMNHAYLADKAARNRSRNSILRFLAEAGARLTIMGDGWDQTDLPDYENVTWLPPRTISTSFEVMADAKRLLDINPMFYNGLHDRVTSGLANSCVTFSNMHPQAELVDGRNIIYYNEKELEALADQIVTMPEEKMEYLSLMGHTAYEADYSWERHAEKLFRIMDCNKERSALSI